MKAIRKRLTYANVMSSIAVFLLLGGATAIAANELGKNSVGKKQLKNNAVTTAKIKKNAVTSPKIKKSAVSTSKIKNGGVDSNKLADNSVTSNKIADGSVTGADINGTSTSFSQLVARLQGTVQIPFTGGFQIYPLNNPTYTQPAERTDQYIGALEVNFGAGCTQPRSAFAYLLKDAENPLAPAPWEIIGQGLIFDKSAGAVTRQLNFAQYSSGGTSYTGMNSLATNQSSSHTFSIVLLSGSCNSGSGVTAVGGGVDVIGTASH